MDVLSASKSNGFVAMQRAHGGLKPRFALDVDADQIFMVRVGGDDVADLESHQL